MHVIYDFSNKIVQERLKKSCSAQAANFGYRKEGKVVTTKGISQLDYFKQVGVRNTMLKNAEKLNFIIDTVKFGMDGKMETLTTMFVTFNSEPGKHKQIK